MNIPRIRILPAIALLLANILLVTSPPRMEAQSPAPSPATAQKRDPFVKDASPTPQPNPGPTKAISLAFTLEVYALSQDDAMQVLAESGTGEARHDAVLRLMNAGKARLETLMCSVGKSGQRTVVEGVDEVRYPSVFGINLPDSPSGKYTPSPYVNTPGSGSFQTRNAGDTLEIEPTLDSDEKYCDVNMVMQRVHSPDFPIVTGDTEKPSSFTQPRFLTGKLTTEVTLKVGEAEFLGTLNDSPPYTNEIGKPATADVRLAFGRIDATDLGSYGQAGDESSAPYIELQATFYSLDREAARQILTAGFEGEACYDAVKALADKGQAKLEHVAVIKTKSGQRAVVQEADELRYPTEYNDTTPSIFETRNAGFTWEVEPTIDASGSILDLNQVPQFVTYEGYLQVNGSVPKIEPQPLFMTQKVTAEVIARLGKETLVGTFGDPGDDGVNGRKDTGRTWFGFVKGTL